MRDSKVVIEKFIKKHGLETYEALPKFLRVLLSTDGTVTDMLESWYMDTVTVERLESDEPHTRTAVLHCGLSEEGLLYAVSRFDIVSLGPMANKLILSELPIGRVIDELFNGTYRNIKRVDFVDESRADMKLIRDRLGCAPYSSGHTAMSARSSDRYIEREYTIMTSLDDKPVVTINEVFNISKFVRGEGI
jgi:chorismate-pyruvate lyase